MARSEEEKPSYTVAAEPHYAYYTRYPSDFSTPTSWPHEAEDLVCPFCGAEEIVILEEFKADVVKPDRMIGDRAQCWMCKRDFLITENCWKYRKIE